jgi:hypothetical protein
VNSNLKNWYADAKDRGNNPDGLWVENGNSNKYDSIVTIAFNPTFGATLSQLSLDVAAHTSML